MCFVLSLFFGGGGGESCRLNFYRTLSHWCSSFFQLKYIGSYMSAHVLLNLLNELGKSDKMRGNKFNKFNNT